MSLPSVCLLSLASRYSAEGWEAVIDEPTWLIALLILLAVSIWTSLGAALREQHAIKPGRWKWLAAMRVVSIILVFALLASFQRRPVSEQVDPSRVVMLIDSSNSMAFPNRLDQSMATTDALSSRSDEAVKISRNLLPLLATAHKVTNARCGEFVTYLEEKVKLDSKQTENLSEKRDLEDFYKPLESESRLGSSLEKILEDYSSTPLSSVVLLTDGRSTDGISATRIGEEFAKKNVRLHVIGFGSQVEPKRIELLSLSVPQQVQIRDPFEVTIRLAAMGGFQGSVDVDLLLANSLEVSDEFDKLIDNAELLKTVSIDVQASETIVSEKIEIEPPEVGKYQLIARLKTDGSQSQLEAMNFESIDRKLQVLLLASAPLRDYRFLRNQLFRDDSFEVDVLLQSATGGISQDVRAIRETFPVDLDELNEYDLIVAYDADWMDLGDNAINLIRDWVSKKGGGLLVVGGTVNSFQLIEQPSESILATLLPVRFREDPLTLVTTQSANTSSQMVSIAEGAQSADFLQIGLDRSEATEPWSLLKGFYQRAPIAELKLGSTPYLLLGDVSSDAGESRALLSDQFFGAGRASYLATPEMWRLRKLDERFYTAFYTRYLRHLAKGRMQGSAAFASLYFDREEYQLGQTMSLRLVMRDEVLQANDQQELNVAWITPNGEQLLIPLRPLEGQAGSFEASLVAQHEGSYRATVQLPRIPEPLVASAQSILPPKEGAVRTQNVEYLSTLTEATGGVYLDSGSDLSELVKETPSRSETRLILGPIDEQFGNRIARNLLIALTAMLSLEWLLRRWWRLA